LLVVDTNSKATVETSLDAARTSARATRLIVFFDREC